MGTGFGCRLAGNGNNVCVLYYSLAWLSFFLLHSPCGVCYGGGVFRFLLCFD